MRMISRVSSKNEGKQVKREKYWKTKTKQKKKKKKRYKETQKSVAGIGVEPGLSARASNSLTAAPQWHRWFVKLVLSYQNNFSLPKTLFEAGGAAFIMN